MLVTYTGKAFDYNNITKESICVDDIAHSLAHINRFVGHSSRPYSVGEHVLWCLYMAKELGYSTRLQLLTLIHDFEEAYTGDCPTPLKVLLPEFSVIAKKVENAIYEHIGIEPPTAEEKYLIKRIDLTMLAIEMRDLTLHAYHEFVDEHTYTDFLNSPNFDLNNVTFNIPRTLSMSIKHSYHQLMLELTLEGEK
ncbi:putative 5'-nucleotidase [Bacillus phage Izhevsk]|uniref:Putative 5'-nucleotidase n=1 Tax=Bacillus phage Izhevsk TaxID=2724322 RepID=A0A6H0X6D6_9CAUD|nr:putative 5'-nucleotidase [Bacillus phage Izhevsk]QIW89863.1 putative 5'-nucleotidase [Bacillus phage Izhevsk]